MALKLRKDIKKSSYYVWFLGAKESKGLRGNEFILPVIKHLEERERDIEPFKVTLQVSHKGLKIIQNVTTPLQQQQQQQTAPSTMTVQQKTKTKNEIIKHFIPHNTITCCYQQDDIIACILLLFNPVTKCPLHIHAYRCDSIETATLLKQQLQTLIDRPDNQKKFAEIESRLKMATMHQQPPLQQPPPMMVKKFESSLCSDRSTRESESSEERYTNETNRNVATLYDSVAAELREKLSKNNVPILLPPRDYDTVHRQKGNLTGIELRRCLNSNIVGHNVLNNNNNNNNNNNSNNKGSKRLESSGGSSGIGSDHPPSPDTPESPDTRYNTMDNHSTSDEDWNGDPAESTLYLIQNTTTTQMTLPRPGQTTTTTTSRDRQSPDRRSYLQNHRYHYQNNNNNNNHHHHQNDNNLRIKSQQYQRELTRYLEQPISKFGGDKKLFDRQKSLERHHHHHHRYYNDNDDDIVDDRINGVDDVYGDDIDGGDDVNDDDDGGGGVINDCRHDYKDKNRKFDDDKPRKYFDDDGFDENLRYRSKSTDFAPRYHYDNPNDYYDNENKPPIPRQRQKYQQQEKFDKPYQYRQRSASPPSLSHNHHHHHQLPPPLLSDNDNTTSPRDRFKDAKEKFLQMEQQRYQHHPHHQHHHVQYEPPISPMITKDKKPFLKRHESLAAYEKNQRPKPAPRNLNNHPHQPLQQSDDVNYRYNTNNGDNYQKYDKYEPKRRSMFSLIEEEHRKNSSEIAKELKRRSYLDNENYSKSSIDLDHIGGGGGSSHGVGYRHSYVEPTKTRGGGSGGGKNKNFGDVLHRTNSISNNGRVGIASIHPY